MSALRVLVDESLPRRFAGELSGVQVSTVREEGWLGLRNGVLLRAAGGIGHMNLRRIGKEHRAIFEPSTAPVLRSRLRRPIMLQNTKT